MKKIRIGTPVKLTEAQLIVSLTRYLVDECDVDQLANLVGEIFGGNCVYDTEDIYIFTPNEDYGGEFGGKCAYD